jgi:hypothetical protein
MALRGGSIPGIRRSAEHGAPWRPEQPIGSMTRLPIASYTLAMTLISIS